MMKLMQLLNYKPDKERSRTIKAKALRWMAGFFALMILCTVLSRAADSLTVAVVEAEKPKQGAIIHTITATGKLEAGAELPVVTFPQVLVQSVQVDEGAKVAAGDVLFTLDIKELKEKLLVTQLQQQKLSLQLENYRRTASLGEERAQEDFDVAVDNTDQDVLRAESDKNAAKKEMYRYKDAYEDVIAGWNGNDYIPPEDADYDIMREYRALKENYHSKQRAFNDALNKQTNDLLAAKRALDDAKTADIQAKLVAIDYRLEQITQTKLKNLIGINGEITAPVDAIVSKVEVEAGNKTADSAAMLITQQSAGLRFTGEIETSQLKYIARGDSAKISLSGVQTPITGLTVESVRSGEDKNTASKVSVLLPAGSGELGMWAEMQVNKKTKNYPTQVPLTALRGSGIDKYVLVLRESETVLGKELTAERINVTVDDSNEESAAVSGLLDSNDPVIVSSNKAIHAGDRVRLQTS